MLRRTPIRVYATSLLASRATRFLIVVHCLVPLVAGLTGDYENTALGFGGAVAVGGALSSPTALSQTFAESMQCALGDPADAASQSTNLAPSRGLATQTTV
jgi:hypothetical protein